MLSDISAIRMAKDCILHINSNEQFVSFSWSNSARYSLVYGSSTQVKDVFSVSMETSATKGQDVGLSQ